MIQALVLLVRREIFSWCRKRVDDQGHDMLRVLQADLRELRTSQRPTTDATAAMRICSEKVASSARQTLPALEKSDPGGNEHVDPSKQAPRVSMRWFPLINDMVERIVGDICLRKSGPGLHRT